MNIRHATQYDAAELRQLMMASAEVAKADFDQQGWATILAVNTLQKCLDRILHDDYLIWVAEQNGELLGMLIFFELQKLDQFFVHPDHLGQGIGKQLWQYAFAEVKRLRNDPKPPLWVRSSSYAIPVYQAFGFQLEGGLQNNNGITFQLMRLPATPATSE